MAKKTGKDGAESGVSGTVKRNLRETLKGNGRGTKSFETMRANAASDIAHGTRGDVTGDTRGKWPFN